MTADPSPASSVGEAIDLTQDPRVAQMLRQASLRGAFGGFSFVVLLLVIAGILKAALSSEFWHGAGWGFGIGLGILLGGTVLNLVIGLLDQVKSDISGN